MTLAHAPFDLDVSCREGTPLLAFKGELDLASVGELRVKIDYLLAKGHRELVFDASELSFVDSTGLSALLSAARRATVSIENASPCLAERLRQLGVTEALGVTSAV